MNGVIDLSPAKRIIDRRAVRLEWIAKVNSLQLRQPFQRLLPQVVAVKPEERKAASLIQRGRRQFSFAAPGEPKHRQAWS